MRAKAAAHKPAPAAKDGTSGQIHRATGNDQRFACYEDQETSREQVVSETLEMHGQQRTCDDKGNAI